MVKRRRIVATEPKAQMGQRSRRRRRNDLIIGAILAVIAFLGIFPFAFALIDSFKDDMQFAQTYWLPAFPLHLENYTNAWGQFSTYWMNSVIVAVSTTAGILVLGTISGFVFARYEFPGRGVLFFLIIILLAVPGVVNLVPLFLLVKSLQLLNTLGALIVVYTVASLFVTVYLLRNAIAAITDELFDAAKVDGASGPQIYRHIVLPLYSSHGNRLHGYVTGVWNEYAGLFSPSAIPKDGR